MTKRIPRNLIEHLGWRPNQTIPLAPTPAPTPPPPAATSSSPFTIEHIIRGTTFYSDKKEDSKWIGLPIALREALTFATPAGIVASAPEFIAAKTKTEKTHDFWKNWYTVHTEENIGIDKKGRFYTKNKPVLVVVHGGGILTPERIEQAYTEGLVDHSAKYTQKEFDELLEGKITGTSSTLPLFRLEEIKVGISSLPHRFGIIMPYETAQKTNSGYHQKKPFLENPLVLARAGTLEHLEKFYEKSKHTDGDLGNYHPFKGRDPQQPQGRVLFVSNNYDGLSGFSILDISGRFVGVAPEAHGKKI